MLKSVGQWNKYKWRQPSKNKFYGRLNAEVSLSLTSPNKIKKYEKCETFKK